MKRKLKIQIAAAVLLAAVITGALISGVYSKYVRTETEELSITYYNSELAKSFEITEHEVSRTADGDYSLTETTTSENSYEVMPGVDIPKDPQVVISGKTAVTAYLYIEVVKSSDFPNTIEYSLTDNWLKFDNVTGKNGGVVYVYTTDKKNPAVLDESFSASPIKILKDDKITVDEKYSGSGFSLSFYGYMAQNESGKDAGKIFTENFKKS